MQEYAVQYRERLIWGWAREGIRISLAHTINTRDPQNLAVYDITPSLCLFSLENTDYSAQGTYVTTVTARDGDEMLNAPVEYTIDAGKLIFEALINFKQ